MAFTWASTTSWAKVSLHEESVRVALIILVPGKPPAVCESPTELLDLYPAMSSLCGLDDPEKVVRGVAFSVNGKGFLLRE